MFNIDQAPNSKETFQALPAGLWLVRINGVELKHNKNGNGSHFAFSLEVHEPRDFDGYKINHRCTYESNSQAAREIGHAQLADLLYAVRVRQFRDVDELVRLTAAKEFLVETQLEEAQDGKFWPTVVTCWNVRGEHRNNKRNLDKVALGENGKPPKPARNRQPNYQGLGLPPGVKPGQQTPYPQNGFDDEHPF